MTDTDESKQDSRPSPQEDSEDKADARRTQAVKPSRKVSDRAEDESALTFDNPGSSGKEKDIDPTRDTAVLSKDSPLLKRAISHQASSPIEGTTTLGDTREVILLIRGFSERIVMKEGIQYKLGRFELGMKGDDEIDLTPYGAMDRGVSRVHARLHLEEDTLYITDLGSTNGTYLSGNRLEADDPKPLRKGDELLLGRLALQVLFR